MRNDCDSPRETSPGFPFREWVHAAYEPLRAVTKRTLKEFPKVTRWDDPDDVLHGALVRLLRALPEVEPASPQQLFALGAQQVRRECLDRARRYSGPAWRSLHAHVSDPTSTLGEWAAERGGKPDEVRDRRALPEALGKLSLEDREFLRLVLAEGQEQAARRLRVSVRTAQRRWTALLQTLRGLLTGP